jgi:hypothetical protein
MKPFIDTFISIPPKSCCAAKRPDAHIRLRIQSHRATCWNILNGIKAESAGFVASHVWAAVLGVGLALDLNCVEKEEVGHGSSPHSQQHHRMST